jgi:hypothetical protein
MAGIMSRNQTRDLIFEKILAWGQDPEIGARYPDHTHFIEADDPKHAQRAMKVLREGNPAVLVYPDGHELLICPEPDGGTCLEARDTSGRSIAA